MEKDNVIVDKSKVFALRIIKMYKYLCDEKKEFVLSKQVLRSGTSIGANIREGVRGLVIGLSPTSQLPIILFKAQ